MDLLSSVNLFDVAASITVLVLCLYGAFRGMARVVIGLAGLAAAWLLATRFCEWLAVRWGASSASVFDKGESPDTNRLVAFGLIFLGVWLASWIIGWLVARALGAVKLRWLDRLCGFGLGLLAAIVFLCAVTVPVLALLPPDGGALMKESRLAPFAVAGAEWLAAGVPAEMRTRFTSVSKRLLRATMLVPDASGAGSTAPKEAPGPRRR